MISCQMLYLNPQFSCRYYDLDAYHSRKVEKEMKKGFKKVVKSERTVFNDEEQRRYVFLCIDLNLMRSWTCDFIFLVL